MYGKSTAPFLSGLAKKLVDMFGHPRERLSLALVKGNVASILACVQVLSYFNYSQCTNPVVINCRSMD